MHGARELLLVQDVCSGGSWSLESGKGDTATDAEKVRGALLLWGVGCNLDGDWAETRERPINEDEVVRRLG
jgi:hypothetical protein